MGNFLFIPYNSYSTKKAGFIACFFLLFTFSVGAQSTQKAYHHLLRLEIEQAEQQLNSLPSPTSHALYLKSLAFTARILITENDSLWQKGEHLQKEWIDSVQQFNTPEKEKNFWQAELYLHRGIMQLQMGEELSGAWYIWNSIRLLEKNHKEFPDHIPTYKSLGFLHLMLANIPDKYQWIASLFGLNSEQATGIEELQYAAYSPNIVQQESLLILYLVQAYLLEQPREALTALQKEFQTSPDNLLTAYLYASILLKNNQAEAALHVIRKHRQSAGQTVPFPFLHYLEGQIMLQKGRYAEAIDAYQHFRKESGGKHHFKDATYKTGLAYWMDHQEDSTWHYYEAAYQTGKTFSETDRHTQELLNRSVFPKREIMRVRLLTDGGYFQTADSLIKTISTDQFSESDKKEWTYRLARLKHLQGEKEAALPLYAKVLDHTAKQVPYYIPNSALQKAYIFRDTQRIDSAAFFFQKALKYKNYPYESSIRRKAKAGLETLKNQGN